TPEDLMAYLYAEAGMSLRLAIQDGMRRDPVLAREVEELRRAKARFPRVKFTAPQRSLDHILNYSRSTALEEQI
ncbi:MAG: hypothetical protein AAGJ82_06990, partial [Bacteroidota bacterium]